MQIHKTSDYSLFGSVVGNRRVNENHVIHLMKSIRQRNLLEQNPIIVTEDMRIVDGQHRLMAAEKLGVPIYYVFGESLSIDDIRIIQTAKRWTMRDYAESYAAMGDKEYRFLLDYVDEFGISIGNAGEILTETNHAYRIMKEGKFVVVNPTKAYGFAQFMKEVEKYVDHSVWTHRDFIRASFHVFESEVVDNEEILDKLKIYHESGVNKIDKSTRKIDYLRQYEDVYNFHRRGPRMRIY